MCVVASALGDDDAYVVERAADPLHRARVYSKLFGNDADTGPPRSRQSLTDSFFQCRGNWGPPQALTLIPGPREASDSFLNHRLPICALENSIAGLTRPSAPLPLLGASLPSLYTDGRP